MSSTEKDSRSFRSELSPKDQEAICRRESVAIAILAFTTVVLCVFLVADVIKVMEPGPAGFVTWLFLVIEAVLAPFTGLGVWASLKVIQARCPDCPNRKSCRLLVRKSD